MNYIIKVIASFTIYMDNFIAKLKLKTTNITLPLFDHLLLSYFCISYSLLIFDFLAWGLNAFSMYFSLLSIFEAVVGFFDLSEFILVEFEGVIILSLFYISLMFIRMKFHTFFLICFLYLFWISTNIQTKFYETISLFFFRLFFHVIKFNNKNYNLYKFI